MTCRRVTLAKFLQKILQSNTAATFVIETFFFLKIRYVFRLKRLSSGEAVTKIYDGRLD
jgi:hypothetical protein